MGEVVQATAADKQCAQDELIQIDSHERRSEALPWPVPQAVALLHESSLARTMPTDRILTGRGDMTLVGRVRSAD